MRDKMGPKAICQYKRGFMGSPKPNKNVLVLWEMRALRGVVALWFICPSSVCHNATEKSFIHSFSASLFT
ncbi:hypothetical protein V6N11_007588 [Hibiscus sabdariffa]|uniref:Uncharacterized protein n=1 Tax=Hibiscus sabdariffa TaxID=183260 RepID=A0ABR2NIY8_9ROSI